MRQRPQPSPRRGLLRAALVIICLLALLFAAVATVSSLTAPSVKAPAIPTPAVVHPHATLPPVRLTPHPAPTTQPTKHKDVALQTTDPNASDATAFTNVVNPSRAPRTAALAFFRGSTDPYGASTLYVQPRAHGLPVAVGTGDALSRPVWSPNGRSVLYVAVRQVRRPPGAEWTVFEADAPHYHGWTIDRLTAMNVTPLGWIAGNPSYIAAYGSNTSIFSYRLERHLVGILLAQPVVKAFLAPGGQNIALYAPTNCNWCTSDIYDLRTTQLSQGPSGYANDQDIAWSADGRFVAVRIGHQLDVLTVTAREVATFSAPATLPKTWTHQLELTYAEGRATLTDVVSGRRYVASRFEPLAA